jgi:hypothetical protein
MIGIFPCRKCLLLTCCTEDCEKVSKKNEHVKREELNKDICPYCGNKLTYENLSDHQIHWKRAACDKCHNIFTYTNKIVVTRKQIEEAFEPVKIVAGL